MSSVALQRPIAPTFPLDHAAQQLINNLQTGRQTDPLLKHLKNAAEKLSQAASQLNERGMEFSTARVRKRNQMKAKEDHMESDEEAEDLDFDRRVQDLTDRMEASIRAIIDEQAAVSDANTALKGIIAANRIAISASQHQAQRSNQRARRNLDNEEDDNEQLDEEEDEEPQFDAASKVWIEKLQEQAARWRSMSNTERYAQSNDYKGFYVGVYWAKNPGEDVPDPPHESLWFADDSEAPFSSTQFQLPPTQQDEDSDVEVARERRSYKCPITLLTFEDPVSSEKCPHSYEKKAFLEFLKNSTDVILTPEQEADVAGMPRGRQQARRLDIGRQCIRCPVVGCEHRLTKDDVKPDSVLKLRVQRRIASQQKQLAASDDDDEDEEEGVRAGTHRRPVALGSSPSGKSSGRAKRIKAERARTQSMIPESQVSASAHSMTVGRETQSTRMDVSQESNEVQGDEGDEQMSDD